MPICEKYSVRKCFDFGDVAVYSRVIPLLVTVCVVVLPGIMSAPCCRTFCDNRESGANPEQSCCRDDEAYQVRKATTGASPREGLEK